MKRNVAHSPKSSDFILVIDNYDSFTQTLVRYLRELGVVVVVRQNDFQDLAALKEPFPAGILLSPGPKSPSEAGICSEVINMFVGYVPILGICLGHQVIAEWFGGKVAICKEPVHGKNAAIFHDGLGVFEGVPSPFSATRYHSLAVAEADLPDCLIVSARSGDGTVMGIRHRTHPVEGVQFHPEAELTEQGHLLLSNFVRQCGLVPTNEQKTNDKPDPMKIPDSTHVSHIMKLEESVDPETLFRTVRHLPGTVFLDSAAIHPEMGRYSIVAWSPWLAVAKQGDMVRQFAWGPTDQVPVVTSLSTDALEVVQKMLRENKRSHHPGIPFVGGAIGMIGYEALPPYGIPFRSESCHPPRFPREFASTVEQPAMWFWFHRKVLVKDHATGVCHLVASGPEIGNETVPSVIGNAPSSAEGPRFPAEMPLGWQERFRSNFNEEEYCEAISHLRDYIRKGDVYLANMTRQFRTQSDKSGFDIHHALRRLNPASFSAWFPFGEFELISASPERFLQIRAGWVETCPIKGTRPRGRTPEQDEANRAELENSLKDRAELLMVTDLERNDLSIVCKPGSVNVSDLFRIEAHPTVFHLAATVRGELEEEHDAVDCMRACFPGGSITGTPKIRAMEVIRELEGEPRGAYTGCLGYFSYDGDADFSILIRTIIRHGDEVSFGVGGGITWDSRPEEELQETLDKALALMTVLTPGDAFP